MELVDIRLAVGAGEDLEVPEVWFLRGFFLRTSSAGFPEDDCLEAVREEEGGVDEDEPTRA